VTFRDTGTDETWLRRGEHALGTGGAFRDCLLRILPCKHLLSRSLGFDAFVFLLVPTSYVSLPQVQRARLLQPNCMTRPDALEPDHAVHPTALDRPLALQLESEFDEERRRGLEVVDHDAPRGPCVGSSRARRQRSDGPTCSVSRLPIGWWERAAHWPFGMSHTHLPLSTRKTSRLKGHSRTLAQTSEVAG
jgi:hypothetical protein